MTTMGRFKIIYGNPPVLPNKCAVCGSVNGSFLDFGLDLDFYGTVYLCLENCFVEAANSIDYYSPAQHKVALERVEQFRKENNRLQDIVEAYKNVVGSITDINTASAAIINLNPTPTVTDEEPEQEPETVVTIEPEPKRPEPGSIKPVNEQRPTDVQRDDSLDSLLDEI